jgi:peptidoglycan/xylan/chitin deacetylase (PgdA/CDA1 family)
MVVEGELDQPAELTLKGRFVSESCQAPLGPVRWEIYRPPAGEVVELRSGEGKLLAKWDLDAPPPMLPAPPPPASVVKVQMPKPAPAPPPVPAVAVQAPKPVPAPPPAPVIELPYGPWARTEPHLPLPRPVQAPPPVRVPPPAPAVAVQAPRPASAPPPPVAKTQEASLIPRPVPAPRPLPSLPPAIPPGDAGRTAPVPLSPQAAATVAQDWPGAGEGLNLLRGPKGERRICMTFDGGSTAEVAVDVLDALHDHGIRTTIFLTGDFIKKYPDLVLRMIKEGHELGNHTMTHPHMAPRMKRDPRWTKELIQKELLDADRAFYRLTGRPMDPYWRSPFGENTAEIRKWAEELGYRHVDWSEGADTLDWATVKEYNLYRNGTATIERLERRMKKSDGDGLIVLMHLGSLRPAFDRPAKYLGPFMDRAIKDGWHFVCIGEYLKSMGKPRWDPSRRLAWIRQGSD